MNSQPLAEAWPVDSPGEDFALRVAARALSERENRKLSVAETQGARRPLFLSAMWLAAAIATTVGMTVWLLGSPATPEGGELAATQRRQIALDGTTVAVLEAGARLSWRNRLAQQTRGDVFYRVERDAGAFVVQTPLGQVEVLGTCFRVQIEGGPAESVAFVQVFEGEVLLKREGQALKLTAGQSGQLSAAGPRLHHASSAVRTAVQAPSQLRMEELRAQLKELRLERGDLEQQINTLEKGLEASSLPTSPPAQPSRPESNPFDLDQDGWKELAARGQVNYLVPCLPRSEERWTAGREELEMLDITPEAGQLLEQAHRRSNERLWSTVRPLCLDVLGRESLVDLFNGVTCMQIVQNAARAEDPVAADTAFRRVANIRAGLEPPPDLDQPQHPVFSGLWAMTGEMARFEADLAESFGPEEAKRLAWGEGCKQVQTLGVGPEHKAGAEQPQH